MLEGGRGGRGGRGEPGRQAKCGRKAACCNEELCPHTDISWEGMEVGAVSLVGELVVQLLLKCNGFGL